MTDTPQEVPLWKKLIPFIKVGVAVGLIAFLLWVVPIEDQLILTGIDPESDRTVTGTLLESTQTGILFETDEGQRLRVELRETEGLDDDKIERIETATGELFYTPPTDLPPDRLARIESGLLSCVREAQVSFLFLGALMILVGSLIATYRWYLLLMAAELATSFRRAFDLTFIALFFNNIMPGLTGGDLVKAVYIAREHNNRKTEAIITVLLDRILGITGLALVAGIVLPANLDKYSEVAPWIYGLLLAELVVGCVFFSRRIRRFLRLDAIVARLPLARFLKKIDQAVFLYRYRRKLVFVSLLLSMVVHLFIISGWACMGIGLGLDVPFISYFAIVPITLIVMALPIAPSGWGVGEMAVIYFWGTQGVSSGRAFALALMYRMGQLAVSLIGGVCLLFQKERLSSQEVEEFSHDDDGLTTPTDQG